MMSILSFNKYPTYPAYKPSGVEWLGEIPSHWQLKREKYVAWFNYGDSLAEENRENGNFPVYGSNGVVGEHNKSNTSSPCIIIGRKGSFGKINYCYEECYAIDTTFFIDNRTCKSNLRWLFYLLQNLKLDELSRDSAVPGLDREIAHNKLLPFPTIQEQNTIADFLDRETAKIDDLVSKYERLIELLQEKRNALITQAVTRGLDPKAPFKDSGVDWLGWIPRHWKIKKIKFITKINLKELSEKEDPNLEIQYLDIGNLDSNGNINELQELCFEDAPTRARRVISKKDTIISTVRTYLKAISFFENPPNNLIVSTGFSVFTPLEGLFPKFLFRFIQSHYFIETVMSLSNGVSYPAINPTKLSNLIICLLPISEQKIIADFLEHEINKIDNTVSKIQLIIEKMREYRSALVTAAVTGKIDVRKE